MNFSTTFEGHPIIYNAMSYAWTLEIYIQQEEEKNTRKHHYCFSFSFISIIQEKKEYSYFGFNMKVFDFFLKSFHISSKRVLCKNAPLDIILIYSIFLLFTNKINYSFCILTGYFKRFFSTNFVLFCNTTMFFK